MKFARTFASKILVVSAVALCCARIASAQTVQIPFGSAFAGLPTGGSGVLCATSIPTFKGALVGDGCLPGQATLNAPSSTAIDAYGNIYISDYGDKLIRVLYQGGPALTAALIAASPAIPNFTPIPGRIYTLAGAAQATISQTQQTGGAKAYYCNLLGSGTVGLASNGDGCPGTESYIQPRGISIDANGNVFFANLAGGSGMRVLYVGGAAVASLITTLNSTVTSPQIGYVYSITGASTAGFSGDGANARAAAFENVRDVVVDPSGNLYISDGNSSGSLTNNDVREINATTGIITTIAGGEQTKATACTQGSGAALFSGDGGPASAAALNSPYSMFMDASSNLYIADSCNGRLRVIYAGGIIPGISNPVVGNIYTVAGGGTLTAATNVPATQLSITLMQSAGIDAAGNLYVADNTNRYIWQINPKTGIATVFGGLGVSTATPPVAIAAPAAGKYCGASATSGPTSTDSLGDGCPATEAAVSPSLRLIGDNSGNIYEIESSGGILRQFSLNNLFPPTNVGSGTTQPLAFNTSATDAFTLEGAATSEFSDAGGGTCAPTTAPTSNVCVYNVLFKPTEAGTREGSLRLGAGLALARLGGTGLASSISVDPGTQTTVASSLTPQGIAVDLAGNTYIADGAGKQLVLLAPGATATTSVLTGLNNPHQVALDGDGNVYVADTGNNRIAEKPASGSPSVSFGTGLSAPQGLAIDRAGNLYIADTGNNRIVEIAGGGAQSVLPISGLSQPTRMAIDAAGDLFVADTGNNRIVELPANQGQTTLNFGSTTFTPAGVAVDAAGNVYVADSSALQVIELLAGTTNTDPLIAALKKPADLAIDVNGSLYVADSLAPGVIVDNRALGAIGFALTNVGQTSPAPISVANTGNLALTFPGPQLTTATGATADYSVATASSNGCSLTSSTSPGANCLLTASFLPAARGTFSETLSFVTNAANSSAAQAFLSGTGAQLIPTTTAIAITSPASSPSTVPFGTPVILAATVTLSQSGGTPAGTIVLSVDGKAQAPVAFGSGTASATLNLPVGTHVISAQFSGDTVYASSSASLSYTVTKAVSTTVLTLTPSAPGGNPTITFAASVTSATATGETGTISFYAGTTLLGTSAVASNKASYVSTSVTFASNSFTAVYSGDANFATSTSAAVQPSPDFAISSSGTILATAQGGVATAAVTITPLFNMSSSITPSCTNLPAYAVCRFLPTTIAVSGTSPIGVSVEIYTNVPPNIGEVRTERNNSIAFALLAPWGLGILLFARRRSGLRLLSLLLLLACGVGASIGFTGCANSSATTPATPTGTQSISVGFTSTGATAVTHALNFTFTVSTP